MTGIPVFAAGLCDDAAVFPPGRAPLADAVPAHVRHRAAPYAGMVGPLVLPATALDGPAPFLDRPIGLSVTAPAGPAQAAGALAAAAGLPVELHGLEVAVPAGWTASGLLRAVDGLRTDVPVFVEVPRDERRPAIIAGLAASGHRAKFRTGGITADLHPDPDELASAVKSVIDAGVPFKATAGLHHPVRGTDPGTGFDQHGFLNLLLAADAALDGRPVADLAALLAERDAASIAARVADLPADRTAAARAHFLSFGTCSITDPLTGLAALGLLPAALTKECP